MNFNVKMSVQARFKLVFVKDSAVTEKVDWFCNHVLDSGLERMAIGGWADRCIVGNHGAPLDTDTKLDVFLASSTKRRNVSGGINLTDPDKPFFYGKCTYRYAENEAVGNIGAVGLGWANDANVNIAQVKDPLGAPIVVQKTADEILDIHVEWRVYPQLIATDTFDVKDKFGVVLSTHNVEITPYLQSATFNAGRVELGGTTAYDQAQILIYSTDMPASLDQLPVSGGLSGITSREHVSVNGASTTYKFISSIENHVGNWRSVFLPMNGLMSTASKASVGFRLRIDPPIEKATGHKLTSTFTVNWGRYVG